VLQAARERFIAQGYGATTIDQIARRAGVSKPTVFSAVGNKQTVLRAVRDVAIAGDDDPVPVAKRPAVDRVRAEPDLRRAVALLAEHLTGVASRYAELHEVVHAAADGGEDDLRELWQLEEDQRLTGARLWVEHLTTKAPLRPGLDPGAAADVLWLLMSPDTYYRLVHGRRWTTRRYRRWLAGSIAELLFAPIAGTSTR
jgi:AcrR family transcriptional regulator